MTVMSVSGMLNHVTEADDHPPKRSFTRPAVLDISNLLCPVNENSNDDPSSDTSLVATPSLSPSLTPSPVSVSSSPFPWPVPEDATVVDPMSSSTSLSSISTMGSAHWSSLPIKKQWQCDPLLPNDKPHARHTSDEDEEAGEREGPVKAKRRRANAKQLQVLNQVFDRTFFPSTQLRAELGRQLGMTPRTVQIWFQNKRQAMKTREKQRLLRIRDEPGASMTE